MTITELILYAVISFIVILWCYFKWKQRPFERVALKMTGPPAYPIVGFVLELMGTPERKKYNNNSKILRKIYNSVLLFRDH